MSYLVLARKYRPQTFDEVVGQEHITDLLKKAVESGRLTHAYLFCGPRGIGKTSCARILAKSLNCVKGPTIHPCGKCTACLEIAKGASFDVLEIDGASNRGIDEIRTLRENVKFAAGYGNFKIYIVDEVHMLTTEAFNALLKTLEEPPEHVKFIFATTAPHKIPATITSRCQRFDFKRMAVKTIAGLLADVSQKEKLAVDQEALYTIAKSAQGSLRDGLGILDQVGALSGQGGIHAQDVFSMLGLVETQLIFDLTDALGQKNCALSLKILEDILDKGKDIRQLAKDITEHFRHLMIIKVGGKDLAKLVYYPAAVKEMRAAQCRQFMLKGVFTAIDVLIEAQDTARITESMRMPLEVAFAKLTYQGESPVDVSRETARPVEVIAKQPVKKNDGFFPSDALRDQKGQVNPSGDGRLHKEAPENMAAQRETGADPVEQKPEPMGAIAVQENSCTDDPQHPSIDLDKVKKAWDLLTHAVSREKMSVATYLQEGFPSHMHERTLTIGFPSRCAFQKEALEDQRNCELVERIFSDKLKTKIAIQYAIVEDADPPEEAEHVKDALNMFGGKVVSRWHHE